MALLETLAWIVGLGLGVIILLNALYLYLLYWLIKKHPVAAIFALGVLIVISTVEAFTVAAIVPAMVGYVTAAIAIMTQYARLRTAFKKII